MDKYKLKTTLGVGYSGEVIEVVDCYNQSFALKKFPKKNASQIKKYKKEVEIHSSLKHENIVKFIESIETEKEDFILMEKCEENLQEVLLVMKETVPEPEMMEIATAIKIFENLCAAIFYMHKKGFVHRDIKPENLLKCYDPDGEIWKLCDFGFSDYSSKRFSKIKGTLEFISPEAVIASDTDETYEGMPADIWAMGVFLYELLYLKSPFSDTASCRVYRKIRTGQFTFSGRDIGKKLRMLIRSMLTLSPENRVVIEVLYVNVISLSICQNTCRNLKK